MYSVCIGEVQIIVKSKEDATKLIGVLFELDCFERISFKPLAMQQEAEVKNEKDI